MIKFLDNDGRAIATLDDNNSEPVMIEDKTKKKKSSKKKIKSELGYYAPPLPQTTNQITPVICSKTKDDK